MTQVTKYVETAKSGKLSVFEKKILERERVKLDVCPECTMVKVLVPVIYPGVAVKSICIECFENGEQTFTDINKSLWYALYRRRASELDKHLVAVKGVINAAKVTPIS